jgi:hypothetical protein
LGTTIYNMYSNNIDKFVKGPCSVFILNKITHSTTTCRKESVGVLHFKARCVNAMSKL